MSMYLCSECDEYKDDDYYPCTTYPIGSDKNVCPSCMEEIHEMGMDDHKYKEAKEMFFRNTPIVEDPSF